RGRDGARARRGRSRARRLTMPAPGDRLQLLYEVARGMTTFTDLDALLGYATRRTRELLGAECCSVLLLDETGKRLYFPVASQADAAVACENARLYARLRGESLGLRNVCRSAGLALGALGVAWGFAGFFAHLARALPATEALTRPSTLTAALLVALGGALGA